LLDQLIAVGTEAPDIFLISPFRVVAFNLRRSIRQRRDLESRLGQPPWQWAQERVGTIHTFQGKEAQAVVLVLGAPLEGSAGARRWAGSSPNLLNVAASRAKQRLYVVGDRSAWKDVGVFRTLAARLPATTDFFSE
jgi:superfamily I DNA and/or RNA helicase